MTVVACVFDCEAGFVVVCAVEVDKVGHNAATIPPFSTMPNKVLALTVTPAHESVTLCATDCKAAIHAAEHPF